MSEAVVHSRRHLHQTRVLDIGVEDVTLPSGVRTLLDVARHPGASCVLPLDVVDGVAGVTLIHQFRHCADGWLWEAPAGTMNQGETPEQCALREVIEEAGVQAGRLECLGFIFPAPGFTDEKIHLYLARDCTPAPVNRDDDEVITEVKRFTWPELMAMLGRNELQDGKTLAVLLHARRFLGL